MFNKITIIGVGLIGGAIGLAVKKKKLAKEIVGISRRESSRKKALKFKAVNKATRSFKKGIDGAELVIIATPVGKIENMAKKAVRLMKKDAILTDVGSIKRDIVEKLEKIAGEKVNFIGTHPMAGSEKTGVENAKLVGFKNAPLLMTKTKKTDSKSLARLGKFWKRIGTRVFIVSPREHDQLVSLTSYLPHAVSACVSLAQTKKSLRFAAGSLKDATRVSSSDPELWKDIFLSARGELSKSLNTFLVSLKALEKAIKTGNGKRVKKILDNAKKISDSIPRNDRFQ